MLRLRTIVETVVLFAVVITAVWIATDTHQLIPTEAGCGVVRSEQARIDCHAKYWVQRVEDGDLSGLLRDVARDEKAGAESANLCHKIMHSAGRSLAASHKLEFSALPSHLTACQSGLVHGMVEDSLRATDPVQVAAGARAMCMQPDLPTSTVTGCFHGVGHAVVRNAKGALSAHKLCSGLNVEVQSNACRDGAVMEWGNDHSVSEMRKQCPSLTDRLARYSCFLYMPNSWVEEHPRSGGGVLDLMSACDGLGTRGTTSLDRLACVQAAGGGAFTPAKARPCTSLKDPEESAVCTSGFVIYRLKNDLDSIPSICAKHDLPAAPCSAGVGAISSLSVKGTRTEAHARASCSKIVNAADVDVCVAGALGCLEDLGLVRDAACDTARVPRSLVGDRERSSSIRS